MFTIIFLLVWSSFASLMSIYVLSGWWIVLWIFVGYLLGYVAIILTLAIHVPILSKLPVQNRYKGYVSRSCAVFVALFLFNLRIKYIHRNKIPLDGPMIAYSNHKSYIDPVIMIALIQRPSAFTPKSSLYKIPLLKQWMTLMGCMPVYRGDDRKTAKGMIQTIKNIEAGFAMSVFPEGGRKDRDTDEVKQTRAGAFKIAVKSKATIVPVTINGNSRIKDRAPWRKTRITVIVHDPIDYASYKDLNTNEIADIVMNRINEGIK